MAQFTFTFKPKVKLQNISKPLKKVIEKDTTGYIGLDDNLEFYFIKANDDKRYKLSKDCFKINKYRSVWSITLDDKNKPTEICPPLRNVGTTMKGYIPFVVGGKVDGKLINIENDITFTLTNCVFDVTDSMCKKLFKDYKSKYKLLLDKING